jgi:hypothetical protein
MGSRSVSRPAPLHAVPTNASDAPDLRTGGRCLDAITTSHKLDAHAKLIMIVMGSQLSYSAGATFQEHRYYTVEWLADHTSLSERTVQRALQKLVKDRYLRRRLRNKQGLATLYAFGDKLFKEYGAFLEKEAERKAGRGVQLSPPRVSASHPRGRLPDTQTPSDRLRPISSKTTTTKGNREVLPVLQTADESQAYDLVKAVFGTRRGWSATEYRKAAKRVAAAGQVHALRTLRDVQARGGALGTAALNEKLYPLLDEIQAGRWPLTDTPLEAPSGHAGEPEPPPPPPAPMPSERELEWQRALAVAKLEAGRYQPYGGNALKRAYQAQSEYLQANRDAIVAGTLPLKMEVHA